MPVMKLRALWHQMRCLGLKCLIGIAVVLAMGAATCTSGASVDVGATPAALADAAARSAGQPYRTETVLSIGGSPDVVFGTGAINGELFEITVDVGAYFSTVHDLYPELVGEPDEASDDLSMQMVGDTSNLYLRSEFHHHLQHAANRNFLLPKPALEELAKLDERWGRIDRAPYCDLQPTGFQRKLAGVVNPDSQALLGLLSHLDSVEELGTREVRNRAVAGLRVDVDVADLLEALGQPPDALRRRADGLTSELVSRTLTMTTPIDVWVDDEGLVRRIRIGFDSEAIAEELGEDPSSLANRLMAAGFTDVDKTYTIDFFGYGQSVPIKLPDNVVGLTSAVTRLFG
jgi:hypothetical protein